MQKYVEAYSCITVVLSSNLAAHYKTVVCRMVCSDTVLHRYNIYYMYIIVDIGSTVNKQNISKIMRSQTRSNRLAVIALCEGIRLGRELSTIGVGPRQTGATCGGRLIEPRHCMSSLHVVIIPLLRGGCSPLPQTVYQYINQDHFNRRLEATPF